VPSRFLDELPEKHVAVVEQTSSYGGYNVGGIGNYGASRFDRADPFANTYATPGWQRAQKNRAAGTQSTSKGASRLIEGELIAKSTGPSSAFTRGERVFHQKFGYGTVSDIEGNKLTVDFATGPKKVVDSFVSKG
jgi:DNA helicase-2/ATP-dependent DNA helicase PcrA